MKMKIGDSLSVSKRQAIIEAYQKYFTQGYEWKLFFNVSFWRETSYEAARKKFKRFFKYLNTNEIMYFNNFIRCWVFYEEQNTSRGGVHIHALIDRINPDYVNAIQEKAMRFFGKELKVEVYDSSRGAAYYLAKKIDSPKLVQYEFYIVNSKVRHKESTPSNIS